jgi:hypothetical protein
MLLMSLYAISQASRRILTATPSCALALAIATLLMVTAQTAQAQQLTSGSSGREFKQKGIEAVPFEMLTAKTRAKLEPVLAKPSIYRRLPTMAIKCDPDYFRFLVRHPEVIVEIWKLMGVTKMETTRTGPYQTETDDGAGTLSDLELVYGDGGKHVFYGTGTYEGSLLRRKLSGKCVLVLQTEHTTDSDGIPTATSKLDVYLKVDNFAAGAIARTLQPLVGPTADHNFVESLRFVQRLNETTLRNGPGVQMMGDRLEIRPDVLTNFQQVASLTYRRGNAIEAAKSRTRVSSGAEYRTIRSR